MLSVSNDFLLVLSALFSSAWRIMTSFQIPGTNINIPEFLFGCLMVAFVIKAASIMVGFPSIFSGGSKGGDDDE